MHGSRWDAVRRTRELVDAARPAGPHWWLSYLATRPSSRRRGHGTALVQPALAHCDTTGLPAAALVSTWAAVRFLRRLGFEVDRAMDSADSTLALWLLVRPPQD